MGDQQTDLQAIERSALDELDRESTMEGVQAWYARYLGRKDGALTQVLRNLKSLPPDRKKAVGQAANDLRSLLEEKISAKRRALEESGLKKELEGASDDPTLPGPRPRQGTAHPVLQTIDEITGIFRQLGFDVAEGPEIESDRNNFTDLNIPQNHPSRDMHDTFYLKGQEGKADPLLLRTHTSPVQIRLMRRVKPPVRIIAPGRVYRHEATDATHAAVFHQIEGLVVDRNVTFADLKGTLTHFAKRFFGEGGKVRFRPSYFPFVEPGAEMDVQFKAGGDGAEPRWLEMLGAGMVHPQVLRNVGVDPETFSGFAFGMGIERIVMVRHRIPDIRFFLESDLRFLEQFP